MLAGLIPLPPRPPIDDLATWLRARLSEDTADPLAIRALRYGALTHTVGQAFAIGYQLALQALFHTRDPHIASLCVTEKGGGHPRAVETALTLHGEAVSLMGEKRWATLSPWASTAYVVAREGTHDNKPSLRIVKVSLPDPAVEISPMPPTPFAREVPHAVLTLKGTLARAQVLPGDGYPLVRRFRTIEDAFVSLATVGALVRLAHSAGWPPEDRASLLALAAALESIANADADDPTTHITLTGVMQQLHAWFDTDAPRWKKVDAVTLENWKSDSALLRVADMVRTERTRRAWEKLEGTS